MGNMRSVFGYLGSAKINCEFTSKIEEDNLHVFCNSNLKFEKDKISFQTLDYLVMLDGVILNKTQLLNNGTHKDWESFFINNWKVSGQDFLNDLRGEFSGLVYDKNTKKIEVFNNPTGTKQIFYYFSNNKFAFASSAIDLIFLMKKLNWKIELNEEACYSFLAYGSLINNTSWIRNSFRLRAGSIITLLDTNIQIDHYKTFVMTENNSKSKKELLATFDKLITNAVKLEWQKDKEYGYSSFSTLSGGLDSRVNVMLARELGFTTQTNFCCSQKGYADETISREMAKDFGHEYYFHSLDGLEHFYQAEYMNHKIGGATVYMGPAHLRYGVDTYWNNSFGIIHSGQLGDGLLGGFISGKKMVEPNLAFGREPYENIPKLKSFEDDLSSKYSNEEMFKMYERGFQIANSGFWILEDLSYYSSPFMDIDILDFLSELPYKYKYKRTFYLEWMNTYHPEMVKYDWEYVHSKPNAIWKTKYATTYMRIKYGWRKLISPEFRLKFDMSPEQYWYNNSDNLKTYYSSSINTKLELLSDFEIPYKVELVKFGNSSDVGQLSKVLSMLLVIEEIYKENA